MGGDGQFEARQGEGEGEEEVRLRGGGLDRWRSWFLAALRLGWQGVRSGALLGGSLSADLRLVSCGLVVWASWGAAVAFVVGVH